MLYMLSWHIPHQNRNEVMQRFAASATDPLYAMPEGLRQVARYHNISSLSGVMILESDDPAKVMGWSALWNDIMDFTLEPVIEDEAAGAITAENLARLQ